MACARKPLKRKNMFPARLAKLKVLTRGEISTKKSAVSEDILPEAQESPSKGSNVSEDILAEGGVAPEALSMAESWMSLLMTLWLFPWTRSPLRSLGKAIVQPLGQLLQLCCEARGWGGPLLSRGTVVCPSIYLYIYL